MGKLNKLYGLGEIYQCDLDDKTQRCRKCHQHINDLVGKPKLCAVIGTEEVANFRIGDDNDWK
jgi:hypothetical protein